MAAGVTTAEAAVQSWEFDVGFLETWNLATTFCSLCELPSLNWNPGAFPENTLTDEEQTTFLQIHLQP